MEVEEVIGLKSFFVIEVLDYLQLEFEKKKALS